MATAAVELAEYYQRSRLARWFCWLAVLFCVGSALGVVVSAVGGDLLHAVTFALVALASAGHLAFNSALRPNSVARSLEASKRVLAQGGGPATSG